MNMASMNIPGGPNAAAGVGRLLLLGGAAVVGAINSLFNVEGGHRAIVFNPLTGIKDTVPRPTRLASYCCEPRRPRGGQ